MGAHLLADTEVFSTLLQQQIHAVYEAKRSSVIQVKVP